MAINYFSILIGVAVGVMGGPVGIAAGVVGGAAIAVGCVAIVDIANSMRR